VVAVKKSAKIKPYKFITTRVRVDKDAPKQEKELVTALKEQQTAINNLGTTVNSLAAVLKDYRDNQAKQLAQVKAEKPKFEAQYTTRKGPVEKEGVAVATPKLSLPKIGFLEALMNFLKNTIGFGIGVAALDWLSKEENREKIKTTITVIVDALKAITKFITKQTQELVDDLYTLLSEDATPGEKFGAAMRRLKSFAIGFLAIRYLKNPMKIVGDLGSALSFLNKNILNSKNTLLRRASKLGLVIGAGLLIKGALDNKEEIKEKASEAKQATTDFLKTNEQAQQIGGALNASRDALQAGLSRSSGGGLPLRAGGGWINGPQTGYPVSMDGGRTTAFIGHGKEYVAQKANGGFVIPVDTPATRGNPNLTGLRMSQASAAGYDLGGMMKGFASGGQANSEKANKDKQSNADMAALGKRGLRNLQQFAAGGDMAKLDFSKTNGPKYVNPDGPYARNGTCTAGVIYTGEAHGAGFGHPSVATGLDSGNMPRGLISQVIGDWGWGPIPGLGKSRSIKSPYGNVTANSLTYNEWGEAVVKGLVPSGALVFSTTKGWDASTGSSGNDSAIAQDGGKKLWSGYWQHDDKYKGKVIGSVYGPRTKEVTVLSHPRGAKADGNTTTQVRTQTSKLQLTGTAKERTTPEFIAALVEMCKRLKCDPSDMLGKMASESGLLPNKSHKKGATGLIQFKADTWSGLNTGKPFSWLKTASALEQLPYIEKFLKPSFDKAPKDSRGMVSTGHVYVSTFLPAFAGDPADTVIATKDGTGVQGFSAARVRGWYADNAGLDGYNPATGKVENPDGKITINELAGRIEAKKKEFGIAGGVTTGQQVVRAEDTQIDPVTGEPIPGPQAAPEQTKLTADNIMSEFAGGLASFAKAMGADISDEDIQQFKDTFAGRVVGESPGAPGGGGRANMLEGLSNSQIFSGDNPFTASTSLPFNANIGESFSTGIKTDGFDLNKAFDPKNAELMQQMGFGDALGTSPMHFRPGGGDDKPTPVKPESISSSSSNSGAPSAPSSPGAPPASPNNQRRMIDKTNDVNTEVRTNTGMGTQGLQAVSLTVAKQNAMVAQLRRESAEAMQSAQSASTPSVNTQTLPRSSDDVSLVDQLNSSNNILGQ
tara:strand:+ start:15235 stop:18564 length:3330 start_codon:yes stop_codon:yes gene_type:complete